MGTPTEWKRGVSPAWERITDPPMSAKPDRPSQEDIPVNADDYTSEFNRLMADSDARHIIYSVFDSELDELTQQMDECIDNVPMAKLMGAYLQVKRLRGIFASHALED